MRIAIPALMAALAAGCAWRNPYDVSYEEELLEYEDANLLYLERAALQPNETPWHDSAPPARPNLDAWRASVLDRADASMLARMERDCAARAARLRACVADLSQSNDPDAQEDLIAVRGALRVEEKKLALIRQRRAEERH